MHNNPTTQTVSVRPIPLTATTIRGRAVEKKYSLDKIRFAILRVRLFPFGRQRPQTVRLVVFAM